MNTCKIAILSLLAFALSVSCTKTDQDAFSDPFPECFDIPRPSFLVQGDQEVHSNPDYRYFHYYGKFVGCADKFGDLCKTLGLTQAKAGDSYVMHPPPNETGWWDAPNYLEQLKNRGMLYSKGFTDPEDHNMGIAATAYRGNIYITKYDISSNKWGIKERHITDGMDKKPSSNSNTSQK